MSDFFFPLSIKHPNTESEINDYPKQFVLPAIITIFLSLNILKPLKTLIAVSVEMCNLT